MNAMDLASFDQSRLVERLEPDAYFTRLLESSVAKRKDWLRKDIENRRKMIQDVWRDGDELWYWRYRIRGGISGSDGLAILRQSDLVHAWSFGFIL